MLNGHNVTAIARQFPGRIAVPSNEVFTKLVEGMCATLGIGEQAKWTEAFWVESVDVRQAQKLGVIVNRLNTRSTTIYQQMTSFQFSEITYSQ